MSFSKQLETVISPKFNQDILVNRIQDIFNLDKVVINDIEFKSDQKRGESYLSEVNAFTVKASGKCKSDNEIKEICFPVISKSLPKSVSWQKTFRLLDFFQNEDVFYAIVWKAMNDFQLSKRSEPVFHHLPLYISSLCDGRNDYIVLKDMNYKNYVGLSRINSLDVEHVQMIIKIFARFHALGFAFKHQKPHEFEVIANALQEGYVSERYRGWYKNYEIKNIFPILHDAVEKQLPECYSERFKDIVSNDFYGKLVEYFENKGSLAVITHGDAWIPNFLFKYNSDEVLHDAVLIDFQQSGYASLAIDLTSFLYCCTEQSLRLTYWDILIGNYHKTFIDTLLQLGSDPQLVTFDMLRNEIKTYALFGAIISVEAVIMSLLENDDFINYEAISGDEAVPLEEIFIFHPFTSEEKRQRIADIIKHAMDYKLDNSTYCDQIIK